MQEQTQRIRRAKKQSAGSAHRERRLGGAMAVALCGALGLATSQSADAKPVQVFDFAMFFSSDQSNAFNGGAALADHGSFGPGDCSSFSLCLPGLSIGFVDDFDRATNLGSITWTVRNLTGSTLTNASVYGFLNATASANLANDKAQVVPGFSGGSYEIEDFDASFFTLLNPLYNAGRPGGRLPNVNNAGNSPFDGLDYALGFNVDDLAPGSSLIASFSISEAGGAIFQKGDSGTFFFSGNALTVPEPGTLWLFALGLAAAGFAHRRRGTSAS